MTTEPARPSSAAGGRVPALIAAAGEHAVEQYQAFLAYFGNPATRRAYQVQAERFFRWAEGKELTLAGIYAFDAAFYVEELKQSRLGSTSVSLYRSQVARLFRHLEATGVIIENPFDQSAANRPLPAKSESAAAWQAAVDAAELSLILDSLGQYGLLDGLQPVNQRLCEKVLALGKARGITPAADIWDRFVASLTASEEIPGPDPNIEAVAAAQEASDGH
jgi:hypothetical protein